MEEPARHRVLFIGPDIPETQEIADPLDQLGCDVLWRTNRHEALLLLSAAKTDLLLLWYELGDDTGASLCRTLRNDPTHAGLKIVVIGEDNAKATNAIDSLNSGADDFIQAPFPEGLFEARAKRFLKGTGKKVSAMSVNVEGGELPGILSFLEAEIKTGRLEVRYGKTTAMIYLVEGRLVNARAPNCEGLDAVVEALSFPSSHVTFHEEDVPEEDRAFSLESTGTIMNCVFEVDEFGEAKTELPRADAQFTAANKDVSELDKRQSAIYKGAIEGRTIPQLLQTKGMSERHATMALSHLINEKYLNVLPGPFDHYFRRASEYYQSRSTSFLERRTADLRTALSEIQMPIEEPPSRLPFSQVDWMSPAPKIIILGDNQEHVKMLLRSLELLHISIDHARPMTRKIPGNARATRLQLGPKRELDVIVLPPRLGPIIHHWTDISDDAFAILTVVSAQDDSTLEELSLNMRTLRQKFEGVYYFIVPQVQDSNGNSTFNISCKGCGFTLSADIRYTGAEGECPVCSASFAFPDCLDYLAEALFLPIEVPIIQLKPDLPNQAADLIRMVIDSLDQMSKPLPAPGQTQTVQMRSSEIAEQTEIRERTVVDFSQPEEVPPTPEPEPEPERQAEPPPSQEPATYHPPQQTGDALDDLLAGDLFSEDSSSGGDDFDLDAFIKSVGNKR